MRKTREDAAAGLPRRRSSIEDIEWHSQLLTASEP
jgi:hypothetical protein